MNMFQKMKLKTMKALLVDLRNSEIDLYNSVLQDNELYVKISALHLLSTVKCFLMFSKSYCFLEASDVS